MLDPRRHSPTTGALQTHTAHAGDLTHGRKRSRRSAPFKCRFGVGAHRVGSGFPQEEQACASPSRPTRSDPRSRRSRTIRRSTRAAACGNAAGPRSRCSRRCACDPRSCAPSAGFGDGVYPGGLLERRVKELVIITASHANDCQFCTDSHCDLVGIADILEDPMALIERAGVAPAARAARRRVHAGRDGRLERDPRAAVGRAGRGVHRSRARRAHVPDRLHQHAQPVQQLPRACATAATTSCSGRRPGRAAPRRRRGRSPSGTARRRTRPCPSAARRRASSGQVYGVVAVNGRSPNSTSPTPAPSVPGSQAATTASAAGRIRSSMTGRPERMTTTSRSTSGRTRVDRGEVGVGERERGGVTHALGVRRLGDDDDAGLRVGAVGDRTGAGVDEPIPETRAEVVGDRRARRGRSGRALPRDRPAARLQADVVRAGSREQDVALGRRQRQQSRGGLEQHRRLAGGLAGDRPMGIGPDLVGGLGRHRVLEQAHLELDGQDAGDGVVDPFPGDRARVEPGLHGRLESGAVGRDHDHVDAGRDRLRDRGVVVGIDLVDAGPVGHDEPREPEVAREHLGQQVVVARGPCRRRCSRTTP